MANHIHLYLTRANGKVYPYYNCTTAPSIGERSRSSGEWRNEFSLADLQTDLATTIDNGEGTQVPHVISPIRGGYTLKETTDFTASYGSAGGLNAKQLVAMTDLQVCAPDSVLGKDLRQTTLSITHWIFTIKFGDSTLEIPVEVIEGDVISPGPPLGYEDASAPAVAT